MGASVSCIVIVFYFSMLGLIKNMPFVLLYAFIRLGIGYKLQLAKINCRGLETNKPF
jgi:hypothetical protein